jgi:peptidyl-prolyl cis-trans isomerase A (cyclophilin A)/peptidyl-prolyl cis-trans isomerase B (cyclophilin B)
MFKQIAFAALTLGAATLAAAQTPTTAPVAPATTTAAAVEAPPAAQPRVLVRTSLGDITIELYADKAPKSTENFLQYVRDKFYDGTLFHRVISNFMVQGGGFGSDLRQKATRPPVENEANNGLSNLRGTVSMARTNDPNSATAQFFINVVDNNRLDFVGKDNGFTWGYAVFGKVVSGMDVVDQIKDVPTGAGGPFPRDVPVTPVVINSIEVLP